MTVDEALAALGAPDPVKAAEMAAYHKVERPYLGIANPVLDEAARGWRRELTLEARLALAGALWDTDIHEARVLAAKLLTQARIRPDDGAAWALIASWVPSFDAWAVADHACMAGQRRLVADPARLDEVEAWTQSPHMWTRRAALVMTLPWTKQNHPSTDELATRDRVLGWAAGYVDDPEWFIQKAVAWWLRELSKHDPDRVRAFMAEFGPRMKPFARREAVRKLTPVPEA
ncbi:MAG: DNA alkylation repair protein [Pseudomonadota bacterium]